MRLVVVVLLLVTSVAEAQSRARPQTSGVADQVTVVIVIGGLVVTWQMPVEPSPASRGRTIRSSVSGQIRGRVFDEYGASIPDASVSFEPLDPRSGLTPFGAVTDSRGRFDFLARPGIYRVTGRALGFETTVITQEVLAGEETEVTIVVRRRAQRVPMVVPMIKSCGP
jgi:hypothetical protein